MDNLFAGNGGSSTFEWFPIAVMLSSVLLFLETVPRPPDQAPDACRKVLGFESEPVIGLPRNRDRNQFGTVIGLTSES
jgi:hypothetical protein